ncbi:transcription factor bhlh130 [Phtheirospermum japonicum]|uniref:Transcription factor bhlh130 n=1 Tax=Phtheirospermum japonicum TaxID=374723 RepID=A0A830CT20_9LAMI|nr:transcription factor bhlh130 [Phtheirospermum japonicum]
MFSSEFIGSDYFPNQSPEQNQPSCGLARYKSAPSSFLAALLDSNNNTDNSSSGDESEAFFSALMSGPTRDLNQKSSSYDSSNNNDSLQYHHHHMIKREESEPRPGRNGSAMGYESAVSGGGGFGVMGDVGNYRSSVHNQPKPNISSANNNNNSNGMSTHINFSSAPSSSTRFMPTIPENGNQDIAAPENGQLRNGNNNNANARDFEPVFPHDTWNEPSFSNGLKRNRDGEMRMFSDFNNGETRKNSNGLVHHLSLPKTSSEMAEVEKLLQFQPETTTPCQVRAKRGCATHPRSIAERMRRTRISEKMKKLQDLFPNMDKQTSTADMLDLAVEYIKDLQKQVETLADTKAKCICSSKHQQT